MEREKILPTISRFLEREAPKTKSPLENAVRDLQNIQDPQVLFDEWGEAPTRSIQEEAIQVRLTQLVRAIDPNEPPEWFTECLADFRKPILQHTRDAFVAKALEIRDILKG